MEYKTIEDIQEAIKKDEIKESDLEIVMDNDETNIYVNEKRIYQGKGYRDIEDLWPLVFPEARVDWC